MRYFFSLLALLSLFPGFLWSQSGQDIRKEIQTQLILAEPGDTIHLPAGTLSIDATLSIDSKENIVLKGAGMDATILSFAGQKEGAEGLRIADSKHITLIGFTVQDAKGDNIKAIQTDGLVFDYVRVEWTGKPKPENGAYGFYPVQCSHVLIDHCEAIGASDAGIYVGQSDQVIVRNSRAFHNVAGIEIENTTMAEVHDCVAEDNTGGILVFDLPDLPKAKGGNVRIYNNQVLHNNYPNFAPKGNIVATVPAGTGMMVLATNQVEMFNNQVINHRSGGLTIVSYELVAAISGIPLQDTSYYAYPTQIYVHDNHFERKKRYPPILHKAGLLFAMKYGRKMPDILFDGVFDPATLEADGMMKADSRICISNNPGATFSNMDAGNKFKNRNSDLTPYDCTRSPLLKTELSLKK